MGGEGAGYGGLAFGAGYLAYVNRVEFGGHAGLDEPPFHVVAAREDGGECKDKDILDGISYSRVSRFINLVY